MRFLGPLLAAAVILGAGWQTHVWIKTPQAAEQQARPKRSGQSRPDSVAVTAATVIAEDVPIYRDGIGTVQALNTVVVRAQIEGRLASIAFTEGQMVRAGDELARIDATTFQALYDQAVARKAQSEAALAGARMDLARYRRLAETNAGPKQQADQQSAVVAGLEAQVQADDAAIANARGVLAHTVIRAPIAGRVGLRAVDPGNVVRGGDAAGIVTVTQIAPIGLIFTLPQRDLGAVSDALARGHVPADVLAPDGRRVLATGDLKTLDNHVDAATGTIRLKAEIPNTGVRLWPGQFVTVRVTVDRRTAARVVPSSAIRRGPKGMFVYVVKDGIASTRDVRVDVQDGERAVVADGLAPGDVVVTLGFGQLSNGKAVDITERVVLPPRPSTSDPG